MLSKTAMEILELLNRDDEDEWGYDRELVHEKRRWMLGTKHIPERVVNELIFLCCVSKDSFDKETGFERWAINGTGRDMLVNPRETTKQIKNLLYGGKREIK